MVDIVFRHNIYHISDSPTPNRRYEEEFWTRRIYDAHVLGERLNMPWPVCLFPKSFF